MGKFVECVPNFSEGRRPDVVDQIVNSMLKYPGIKLLDKEMDADHNRCVITLVGDSDAMIESLFQGVKTAINLIDLNYHQGEHPRMGACDVIPFIPIGDTTMDDCIELSHKLGKKLGEELSLPIFMYAESATKPERQDLAYVRQGQFEGLRELIGKDPARTPDYGPNRIHPTAGATAVGARFFLIAFNVNLRTTDLSIAKKIAKAVRNRSGGFGYVKALGFSLSEKNMVQVSMNMTDYRKSPLYRVFEVIKDEAERYGVLIAESEIVGLTPVRALVDVSKYFLRAHNFKPEQILETHLIGIGSPSAPAESIEGFLERLSSKEPVPGGGSVSALAGTLAGALITIFSRLKKKKKDYSDVHPEFREIVEKAKQIYESLYKKIKEDEDAFKKVVQAFKLPEENEEQIKIKKEEIQRAYKEAASVPFSVLELSKNIAELALTCVEKGFIKAISDAGVSASMALSAVKGASYNVLINLKEIEDKEFVNTMKKNTFEILNFTRNIESKIESKVLKEIGE